MGKYENYKYDKSKARNHTNKTSQKIFRVLMIVIPALYLFFAFSYGTLNLFEPIRKASIQQEQAPQNK